MPGVGPNTAIALAERYPTLDQLRDSSPAQRRKVSGSRGANLDVDAIRIHDFDTGGVVGFFDATFPERLKHIPSPPAVLWFRGALPPNEDPALAVVGTREPTQWGVLVAQNAVESAGAGVSIISGLALGIDGTAHARALRVGTPTFAVLGGGVDSPTPKEHLGLAAEILEQGGGLIAEVPPGTKPSARTLVARNRLQAGLSDAVVVAQCGLGSGTMHTARFALLQGRPLIVPEPTDTYAGQSQSQGNLALIKGNDRGAIKASPAEARRIGSRKVFADYAPTDGKSLAAAVATIYGHHGSAPTGASEHAQMQLGD